MFQRYVSPLQGSALFRKLFPRAYARGYDSTAASRLYSDTPWAPLLAKARADFYASKHPTPNDVFLVLEVADTTLRFDRNVKVPIYAKLGIPEVWIEDLKHDSILLFRNPSGDQYETNLTLTRGDGLHVAAFPQITFKVEDLLG